MIQNTFPITRDVIQRKFFCSKARANGFHPKDDPTFFSHIVPEDAVNMSSWDRARFVPWSRIPKDTWEDVESQKERIFRELQRETIEDELKQQERQQVDPTEAADEQSQTSLTSMRTKIPFSSMELLRQAAFGGCIGSVTGAAFGFMDGMRTTGESQLLQKASNAAKGRYLLQGTTRSATMFGVFFGGYHVLKYGLRVTLDPGQVGEIVVAGAASTAALMYKPVWRASMPYAMMLISMDAVNLMMRRTH